MRSRREEERQAGADKSRSQRSVSSAHQFISSHARFCTHVPHVSLPASHSHPHFLFLGSLASSSVPRFSSLVCRNEILAAPPSASDTTSTLKPFVTTGWRFDCKARVIDNSTHVIERQTLLVISFRSRSLIPHAVRLDLETNIPLRLKTGCSRGGKRDTLTARILELDRLTRTCE